MNKQNTHKNLPIVPPGLVTNLPQVSLSFSRGREEKKGPGNELNLPWIHRVEQYNNKSYLLNTMFFLLFCKFISFSFKPCELTLLQHVYEENIMIMNEFHDNAHKWLKGCYTVYTKRLRVILAPIASSPQLVTAPSSEWQWQLILLCCFKDNGRSVPLVFFFFFTIFTPTYSLLWCATMKGTAESSANWLLRGESADGLG